MAGKQRIFMTGASGYVGSVITEFAIADGYEVYGLARSEASAEKLRKLGAVPPFTLDLSKGYEPVIKAQADIADAFADALQGTNKVLVTTGGALMGRSDPNGGETDETAPPPENEFIPRTRIEKHDLSLAEKGITVSAIRLAPFVYGRGGSGISLFTKNGAILCVDEGAAQTRTVHVDDAARLYLLAAKKAKAGEKFIATAPEAVTHRQLVDAIAAVMDVPVKSLTLDEAKATVGSFFGSFLAADCRASGAKAREQLGWEIRETGAIEDIKTGSYAKLAEGIKNGTVDLGSR
ncbi:putative NAD dependent epimerase/dehydratase [Hypoxylon sp. FL1284]|nr:putative NAD dependent epimerase/dehydratase [Hypoxylon sp. FL1284]